MSMDAVELGVPRIARADTAEADKKSPTIVLMEQTKDDMLYIGVNQELDRCRVCLAYGHRDRAVKHLEEALSLCRDYDGDATLLRACQNIKDKLNSAAAATQPQIPNQPQLPKQSQTPRRRRASSQPSEPTSAKSTHTPKSDTSSLFRQLMSDIGGKPDNLPRRASDGSLYGRLMSEVQASLSDGSISQDGHPRPRARFHKHMRERDRRAAEVARLSSANFEGIDRLLGRLRFEDDVRKRTPEQEALVASNAQTVEKVRGWQTNNLPQSPSSFKPSEEPSPRRHSFPVACSPPISPSSPSPSPHSRKRSMHTPTQSSHDIASPVAASVEYSESKYSDSNYSRRASHDETTTALSDTPALTKLLDQVHTNPFTDSQSSISSKLRRLSTEGSGRRSLSISTAGHEAAEPTAPSPLRESFVPDVDAGASSVATQASTISCSVIANNPPGGTGLRREFKPNSDHISQPVATLSEPPSADIEKSASSSGTTANGRERVSSTAPEKAISKTPRSQTSIWEPKTSNAGASDRAITYSQASSPFPFTTPSAREAVPVASTSPPRTPPRFARPTATGPTAASQSKPTSDHSPSRSGSVSSLASIFESPKPIHQMPLRSSSGTQRAFTEGLAAFKNEAGTKTKLPRPHTPPQGRGGDSGRSSPQSAPVTPLKRDKTLAGLQRGNSVSQRVLAINERPPWHTPGKASASVSPAKALDKGRQGAAGTTTKGKPRVWGRHGTSASEGTATAGGTVTGGRRVVHSRSDSDSYVRHGGEMARGAGIRKD